MKLVDDLMKLADDYRAATRKNDIVGVARERLESRLRELLDVDAIGDEHIDAALSAWFRMDKLPVAPTTFLKQRRAGMRAALKAALGAKA